jgi:hypothetical protein
MIQINVTRRHKLKQESQTAKKKRDESLTTKKRGSTVESSDGPLSPGTSMATHGSPAKVHVHLDIYSG